MEREDWLWDHYKHSETVFTNRINFFLVAESMFLVSYATLFNTNPDVKELFVIEVVSILGFLFTGIWLCVNYRTKKRLDEIIERYRPFNRVLREMQDKIGGLQSNRFLGIYLPAITWITWIFLSFLPFDMVTPFIKILFLVSIIEFSSFGFIISYLHQNRRSQQDYQTTLVNYLD